MSKQKRSAIRNAEGVVASRGLTGMPHGIHILPTAEAEALPPMRRTDTIEHARRHTEALLHELIRGVNPDKVEVLNITCGTGKTTIAVEAIRRFIQDNNQLLPGKCILFSVPDTVKDDSLGKSIYRMLCNLGVSAKIYQGRNPSNCQNFNIIDALRRRGFGAHTTRVCGTTDGPSRCPFHDDCHLDGYYSQVEDLATAQVVIAPHAISAILKSQTRISNLDIALEIKDEGFVSCAIDVKQCSYSEIDRTLDLNNRLPSRDGVNATDFEIQLMREQTFTRLRNLISGIPDHITGKPLGDATLIDYISFYPNAWDSGFESAAGQKLTVWEVLSRVYDGIYEAEMAGITPSISEQHVEALSRITPPSLSVEAAAARVAIKAMQPFPAKGVPRHAIRVVEVAAHAGEPHRYLRVAGPKSAFLDNIRNSEESHPVIVLDASSHVEIHKAIFDGFSVRHHDINVAMGDGVKIIHLPDLTYSNNKLIGFSNLRLSHDETGKAADQFVKLFSFIERMSVIHPNGLLIGATMKVERAIKKFEQLWRKLPDNVEILHFGGVRGKDNFKNYEAALCIGRREPKEEDVDGISAALGAYEPLEKFEKQPSYFRCKSGHSYWKYFRTISDPLKRACLESIREDEIEQFIYRLRLSDRDISRPATIYILNTLPLPIPIDAVDTIRNYNGTVVDLARVGLLNGGVLPLSDTLIADIAKKFKVKSLDTNGKAYAELRQQKCKSEDALNGRLSSALARNWSVLSYRLGKHGRPSAALALATLDDPIGALGAYLQSLKMGVGVETIKIVSRGDGAAFSKDVAAEERLEAALAGRPYASLSAPDKAALAKLATARGLDAVKDRGFLAAIMAADHAYQIAAPAPSDEVNEPIWAG